MASEVKEESNSTPSDMKNDEDVADEKPKDVDNSIKDGDKEKAKNEVKEESDKGSDDDEDDDDDDEEVALLDRPVEVTGCRARKKVERLEVSFSTPKEKQEFAEGKGKKLGDCPRIDVQIQKIKVPELKNLHKILFNRIGSANEIKKNIRRFSGFPFEEESADYKRRKASVEKMTASVLKNVCLILDIERKGTKEEIVNRIMSFLMNPEDSGKKVPAAKKKMSKDKKKSTSKKTKSDKKAKVEKDENSEGEPEESNEDDSTGGEASMGGTDEENEDVVEESDDEPKKKSKAKSPKAKSKAEKSKKDEKKTKGTKRKHEEDSSDSSEGEQPAKKSKMPSDEEISKLVKQILESADLQEITMKKVIKQVSDAYPEVDLSHKKAFIKSTIKSVIS